MQAAITTEDIEQLLTEADELIQQIDADVSEDMKEDHRIRFEKNAQNLKRIKSEVQDKIEKKETSEMSSSVEGMHEAIQNIVTAMQDLKSNFF